MRAWFKYLVNCKGEDLKIAINSNVKAGECLVICYPKWRKGFIKVYVEPIDTDVQIAPKYKRYDGSWKYPEIKEHRSIVDDGTATGQGFHTTIAYVTSSDSHNL